MVIVGVLAIHLGITVNNDLDVCFLYDSDNDKSLWLNNLALVFGVGIDGL